jgi:hypothetical protein
MKALINIKESPHYRSEAFAEGMKSLGYTIVKSLQKPTQDDVCVIWNRGGNPDRVARPFDEVGARVLVAENGYCGQDDQGRQYYALALDAHNGSGKWFIGDEDRFSDLGITPAPYRL